MFLFRFICLLCIFFFHAAWGEEIQDDVLCDVRLIDLNGVPSGVVGGCVNILSGHYFESEQDIATFGTNPISLSRFYDSGSAEIGELYDFWDLDLKSEVKIEHKNHIPYALLTERGVKMSLKGEKFGIHLGVDKRILKKGVVNVCSPYLSGRCHLLNKAMTLINQGKNEWTSTFRTPGGETLHFGKRKYSNKYQLTDAFQPNGCRLRYDYADKKVNVISAFSNSGEGMGSVLISRENNEDGGKSIYLSSDDGKRVSYHINRMKSKHGNGKHRFALTSVKSNHAPEVNYEYESQSGRKREKLIRKILPDNRYLKITYGSGSKKRKVSKLEAPVGVDETAIPIYTFEYSKNKTKVFDALGNKKVYTRTKEHRLAKIEEFTDDKTPYRTEELIWGSRKQGEGTFLKARLIKGKRGQLLQAKTYLYDERGNILEECLAGNLSGTSTILPRIKLDGQIAENGCDRLIKTYTYDDNNLVTSETDYRQTVNYTYYPDTALIRLKTVTESGSIKIRYYYEYDTCGALSLEIIDDGNSPDINNLSNVSERRIKRVQNVRGQPIVISQGSLDLSTGSEVLIKKIVNTFSNQGQLIREDVYGCDNSFAFCREWAYDAYGNVIAETNPLGELTTYQYDQNRNCIQKNPPNENFYVVFQYDFANRLLKEEEIHSDGARFSKSYSYDYKGNRTKEVDIYGNETHFVYDGFDRLIKKILPQVPDANGKLYNPEEVYTYNELNHPIKKQDASGNMMSLTCNLYGKPAIVKHADGSLETAIYNPDGTAREVIDALGTKTFIDYDYLGRKIREETQSSEGQFLLEKHWIYSAFHLMQEIDAEGIVTSYRYDSAGRMVACQKGTSETLYFYDTLGRQNQKWELYEEGKYRITHLEHDLLDRITEERVESVEGEIFSRKQFRYDVDGNKTEETVFTSDGICTTLTRYNSHGQPVLVIAPDGSETILTYRYDYRDAYNVPVSYQQVVDSKGGIVTLVGNSLGKTALEERKNIFGDVVQKSSSLFDPCGHLLRKTEDVVVESEVIRRHVTAFEYDTRGRETAVFEAFGDPLQKVTRKDYDAKGNVHKIFKADGVVIEHFYDALGRLDHLLSSDGKISYFYSYDRNHNILAAEDGNLGCTTFRSYDGEGRLTSETLGHGLTFGYGYDRLGRLKEFELPDATPITYFYDAKNLVEVERAGEVHRYRYDLSGKLSSCDLMCNLGSVEYGYDSCLRPNAIVASSWEMHGVYDTSGNLVSGSQRDFLGEFSFEYGYDDLEQLNRERGFSSHAYQFDSLGNRLQKDDTSYEINSLNQLERQDAVSYRYDLNGNLIERRKQGEVLTLAYDPLDRLVEVVCGDERTTYCYDPLQRRISKSCYTKSSGSWIESFYERYLYQGDKEIGTADAQGGIQELRVMGIGCQGDVGAAVAMELQGKTYVPLHDYRGNVCQLLDGQTGEVVESYRYSAYGEELAATQKVSPWRFSSKRVDEETGWVFFGRRHYDPAVGRWTTPDPMWFVDGTNLYCFVGNLPTKFIDPEGLFLDGIFELVKDTILSIFEWMTNGNYNVSYKEDGVYMCADIPLSSDITQKSFDKRSHLYHLKGAGYGNVHVSFVNGVWNSVKGAHENANRINELLPPVGSSGNANFSFSGVYNATHGLWDLVESFLNLFGVTTRPVSLLHKQWDDYFDKCGENGIIIHICHSQGAILTRNALACYDPEKRKRIHVIAVAPAAYINEDLCGSVVHFVSKGDFIPLICDSKGRKKNAHNIQYLDRHKEAGFIDHAFTSKTYLNPVQEAIENILIKTGKTQ